jgi:hypothetical protein
MRVFERGAARFFSGFAGGLGALVLFATALLGCLRLFFFLPLLLRSGFGGLLARLGAQQTHGQRAIFLILCSVLGSQLLCFTALATWERCRTRFSGL